MTTFDYKITVHGITLSKHHERTFDTNSHTAMRCEIVDCIYFLSAKFAIQTSNNMMILISSLTANQLCTPLNYRNAWCSLQPTG